MITSGRERGKKEENEGIIGVSIGGRAKSRYQRSIADRSSSLFASCNLLASSHPYAASAGAGNAVVTYTTLREIALREFPRVIEAEV